MFAKVLLVKVLEMMLVKYVGVNKDNDIHKLLKVVTQPTQLTAEELHIIKCLMLRLQMLVPHVESLTWDLVDFCQPGVINVVIWDTMQEIVLRHLVILLLAE